MNNSTETSQQFFKNNYLWILCLVGVPANTLAIVIVLTMQRMTPATLLVAALAFFDGSALVTKLVFQKVDLSNAYCKLEFSVWFFSAMANWTLMYICLERFIAVCYPLKKMYLVTRSRCCVLLTMTCVVFLAYLVPLYAVMHFYESNDCRIEHKHEIFWKKYHSFISESFLLLIPYITVVFVTAAIIIKLKFYARERRKAFERTPSATNSGNQTVLEENERTEKALTVMLTFTALFFLLFTLPSFIYYLMFLSGVRGNVVFKLIRFFLFDSTHALNFFMYFLTASRFRKRCYKVFRCAKLTSFGRAEKSKASELTDEGVSLSTMATSIT